MNTQTPEYPAGYHVCHIGPLCLLAELSEEATCEAEYNPCQHDSCLELIHEFCPQCYAEAVEEEDARLRAEPVRYEHDGVGWVRVFEDDGGPDNLVNLYAADNDDPYEYGSGVRKSS